MAAFLQKISGYAGHAAWCGLFQLFTLNFFQCFQYITHPITFRQTANA